MKTNKKTTYNRTKNANFKTYCVLRYNVWQVEHTSKTILKHVVYVCCILGSYD